MAETENREWKCHVCGEIFFTEAGLIEHIDTEHPGARPLSVEEQIDPRALEPKIFPRECRCPECDYVIKDPKKPCSEVKCPKCGKKPSRLNERHLELIKDIATYDPKKVNDKVLNDDWRIVLAWFCKLKKDGKFKYTEDQIHDIASKIMREMIKRGFKFSRPSEYKPCARELMTRLIREIGKDKVPFKSAIPDLDKIDPPYLNKLSDKAVIKVYKHLHRLYKERGRLWEDLTNAHVFTGIELLRRGIYQENKIEDALTKATEGAIEEYPTPKGLSDWEKGLPESIRNNREASIEEIVSLFPDEIEIKIPPSTLYLTGSLVNLSKIPIEWLNPNSSHDIDLIHRGEWDRRIVETLVSQLPDWLARKIRYHADAEGPIMGKSIPLYNKAFRLVTASKRAIISPWEVHKVGLAKASLFRPFVAAKPKSCKANTADIQEYYDTMMKDNIPEHLKEEVKIRPISEIGEIREHAEAFKYAEMVSLKRGRPRGSKDKNTRRKPIPFTPAEDELLRSFYGHMKTKEIARRLDRHSGSVKSRAWELGLASKTWRTPFINQELNSSELAYIAGIVDGEGCITRAGKHLRTSICNTDRRLIDRLKELLGEGVTSYLKRERSEKHKTGHVLVIGRAADNKRLLELLLPFLIVKREQANLAIKFYESRFERGQSNVLNREEIDIQERIIELNRRGR